ncbi:hypothetical protein LIER_23932 [Lithospermum erythrorhizon]|uniref:VWFA domain-containing protein n=1 Tax=Lithospermum erythrorhizon TaxID=34254 RepID=A0AAV3QZB0_LITER
MSMPEEFERAVEDGLRLAKRIAVVPPKLMTDMEKSVQSLLPSAPMVFAVIDDPRIVDNPDVPSYQPHVHGRCQPSALIPLQMNGVTLEVDCFLDTAFVTVSGSWRVHCVMVSRSCDCRIAIPMGDQGSILGIEVQVPGISYRTELTAEDESKGIENIAKPEDGGLLKHNIFTLTVPQVDGGSNLSIKARWSQKLFYHDGQFTLTIPYSFPEFVTPAGMKICKTEKILLNANAFPEIAVFCTETSHPLKKLQHESGKLSFSYESDVPRWSSSDFKFTYSISPRQICGGILLQSPGVLDTDQRKMFCFFMYPGEQQIRKFFRKELVFVVDISESMHGKALESAKEALLSCLGKLDPQDMFSVIAFNDDIHPFRSTLEPATAESIGLVTEWMNTIVVAGGGTNILPPLNKALEILSKSRDSVRSIILMTDGAVEDERTICDVIQKQLKDQKTISPRIHTFGIGSFCNHYFLRMLAMVGKGQYDAAFDPNSIEERIEQLFARISSIVLTDITFGLHDHDLDLEVYPSRVPDLSSQSPLIVSGKYRGKFPANVNVRGLLPDMNNFSLDLMVQESNDTLLNKVVVKQQIDTLTAQVWFSKSKELEEKIVNLSVQNAMVSEYSRMAMIATEKETAKAGSTLHKASKKKNVHKKEPKHKKKVLLQSLGVGFGNITATVDNIPLGCCDTKHHEAAEALAEATSNCCEKLGDFLCCMCCIRACSRMNDQCAIAVAQLCGAMACLGCYFCCSEDDE